MGLFERYLSVWVALAITVGIIAGSIVPELFNVIAGLEYAHVNLVIAVLIWLMIYPMMVQIDFSSIKNVKASALVDASTKAIAAKAPLPELTLIEPLLPCLGA